MSVNLACILTVFLPLLGAVLAGTVGLVLPKKLSAYITTFLMLTAATISWWVGYQFYIGSYKEIMISLWQWMEIGLLDVRFVVFFDILTAVMVIVVNTVSALVHLYSIGYMERDKTLPKFMSYLSLFTFFMLFLVTSANFIQMFVGWEGVGLCSYLLIGYWYHKDSANQAAMKAFLVNRVGDLAFLLGIAACFFTFETLEFKAIISAVPFVSESMTTIFTVPIHVITAICLLLFIGAMGKSAQFGLHVWLPDAMEGPTPVSALIHAATMVTAGVFMVVRLSPLFEASPVALSVIAVVGLVTAVFAATVALVQNDIKRVIAYSTCSQLGFMFFAAGVTAYGVAMFHLVTHAFFKALLFLGAGSVIHAMSDEQDMQQMGGLYKYIPQTYGLMWIGTLALAGIPFFSGYYSKHAILDSVWASGNILGNVIFVGGLFVTILTALYSVRVIMLTFHGEMKANEDVVAHIHESPMVMLIPLFILAIGSVFVGGVFNNAFVDNVNSFWGTSLLWLKQVKLIEIAHDAPLIVKLSGTLLAILGLVLGFAFFGPMIGLSKAIKSSMGTLYRFLYEKWYIDELYTFLILRPYQLLGTFFWKRGDGTVIDGIGPNGVSRFTMCIGKAVAYLQTGYLYHYLLFVVVGLLFVLWLMRFGIWT